MSKEVFFEETMSELERIVSELENGKLSLEEAIKAFEKGMDLKRICEKKLQEAQLKVEKIVAIRGDEAQTEEIKL